MGETVMHSVLERCLNERIAHSADPTMSLLCAKRLTNATIYRTRLTYAPVGSTRPFLYRGQRFRSGCCAVYLHSPYHFELDQWLISAQCCRRGSSIQDLCQLADPELALLSH